MTVLKFACISPHPPIIVREVGKGWEREVQRTIDALEQLAIARSKALIKPQEPVSQRRFEGKRLR